MPDQHFSRCSVLLLFCPVTVTEPVCVQFKIKGCSYLWAEGVYTRSARTLSSSEYLLSGPVPWLLSHDGIWRGFCASMLLAEHVPTVDGALLWSHFHIPVGFFFFPNFRTLPELGCILSHGQADTVTALILCDAKCNSIAGSVHCDIII